MSINKVIIVGNVGNAPEIRYMPNGNAVANFSMATTDRWTDKQSGEKKEATEWHNMVAYDPLAKIIEQYIGKGSQIYVEGKLRTRKWQDKNGNDRYTTEILVNNLQMLDKREDGQNNQRPQHSNNRNSYQDARNGYGQQGYTQDTDNEDIPF